MGSVWATVVALKKKMTVGRWPTMMINIRFEKIFFLTFVESIYYNFRKHISLDLGKYTTDSEYSTDEDID
uniref:Ovule protein n=1 Tax=Heterorhabditis bacteriophora TaxID=37862 RepID=A0A1I7X7X8_HETBA